MRPTLILFLSSALLALVTANCATPTQGQSSEENAEYASEYGESSKTDQVSKQPPALKPNEVPSRLIPTLKVAVDSCYVFLKPKSQSPYFGPLLKGEEIKRLDVHESWIRVWIPRLREAGWVLNGKVYAISRETSSLGGVPLNLLTTVIVLTKRANVRAGPTTQSRIILEAKKGHEFYLLNEKKSWYQIWIDKLKKKGWIYEKIVTKKRKR